MDIETKMDLILREPTEEVITREDLKTLLETKEHPVAYDGFEPSGIAHLGSGLLRAIKLQDMIDAGVKFKLLVADWFGWINNKMGGDLEKIQQTGKYLVDAWKACGVDTKKVEIVWTNDVVKDPAYWKLVIEVAKMTTINRMIRASTVMGREEKEMQYAAQLLYPAMQTADPFYLGVDICQLGMDQRKCTILSREIGPKIGKWSPVCVHHHLLMGLQGSARMGSAKIINYKDTQEALNTLKKDIEELINNMELLKDKHFSSAFEGRLLHPLTYIKTAIIDVKEKAYGEVNYWVKCFEKAPVILSEFLENKINNVKDEINKLNKPLQNAIVKGNVILPPDFDEWVISFKKLRPFTLEVSNKLDVILIESKMSKSKPMTAIFIHDTEEEIKNKISAAFCPEKQIAENPVLEICKYILFRKFKTLKVERPAKFGGAVQFNSYQELEKAFAEGKLHPQDLKNAVALELEKLIKPVREYFDKNKKAKELYEIVKGTAITR